MADRAGLPVTVHVTAASPHAVPLVAPTLTACFVDGRPERLIGDTTDESDPRDATLAAEGITMIAPHRAHWKASPTQDSRPLRRSKRRWKVERLFA